MSIDLHRHVYAQVDSDRDFVIGLTKSLVRIPTVNPKFKDDPQLSREADLQAYLEGVLRSIGLSTEMWDVSPGRPNLVGTLSGSEDTSLILNGHIDVVPPGDRANWSVDPFGGELKEAKIYGRGSLDMKAGVAAAVAAVKAVVDSGIKLRGRVAIHSVVDEESSSEGTRDIVRLGKLAKAVIVPEPSWGAIYSAAVGEEWVRVTIRGRAGHAGWRYNEIYPQIPASDRVVPSVNAIDLGVRLLVALREYEREKGRNCYHPLMPAGITTINAAAIFAGAGIGADGLPITTSNPAITPDTFVADFQVKSLPSDPPKQVRADFEEFIYRFAQTDGWLRAHPPTVKWELHNVHFPPVETPTDHEIIQSIAASRARTGLSTQTQGFVAVADTAFYSGAGVPAIIYGPGGNGIHAVDEYVEVESLVDTTKHLAAAIIGWCKVH